MIKAIILDMGGVILNLDKDICVRNFKEKAGFECIEDFMDIYHQKGFISDFEEGKIDEAGFYDECRKYCPEGTSDEVLEYCFQSLLTNAKEDVIRQIRELSTRFDFYVLTNNNPVCTRRFFEILEENGARDCFKEIFCSYKLKLLKPGAEIFNVVLEKIGCKPGEALFIDDAIRNVEGARKVGINAELYCDGLEIGDLPVLN